MTDSVFQRAVLEFVLLCLWLLRISLVQFSLMPSFKNVIIHLPHADFMYYSLAHAFIYYAFVTLNFGSCRFLHSLTKHASQGLGVMIGKFIQQTLSNDQNLSLPILLLCCILLKLGSSNLQFITYVAISRTTL